MNKYIFVLIIWVILVAVFGTAGYLLVTPATSRTLRERGVTTEGRVIGMELDNHR